MISIKHDNGKYALEPGDTPGEEKISWLAGGVSDDADEGGGHQVRAEELRGAAVAEQPATKASMS